MKKGRLISLILTGLRRLIGSPIKATADAFTLPLDDQITDFANRIDDKIDHLIRGYDLPFQLSDLQKHCYILAGSGAGKSELIKYFFYELQRTSKNQQRAIILIEPHGDLSSEIKRLKLNKESDRLIYIDPYLKQGYTPTINPLYLKDKTEQNIDIATQEFVRGFDEVLDDADISRNMNALIKPCVSTLLRMENATIADLQRFMKDETNTDLVALGKQSPVPSHRAFFNSGFQDVVYRPTKASIYIKLQSLLNSPTLCNLLLGANTIDLEQAMNDGKVIVFNLSKGKMGDDASNAFGRFMLATIQGIIKKREFIKKEYRKPVYMFIDEFQNYVSPSIETILSESRKFKLNVTLAHQYTGQIDAKLRDNVLSNTTIKIAGKNNDRAYKMMSKEMKIKVEDLEKLPPYQFWLYRGKKEPRRYKAPKKLINRPKSYLSDDENRVLDGLLIDAHYKKVTTEQPKAYQHPQAPSASNENTESIEPKFKDF